MKRVLEKDEEQDRLLLAVILSTRQSTIDRIGIPDIRMLFHVHQLRARCLRHALRLLPAGRYKGSLPTAAVVAVRDLERRIGRPLKAFHMLAPERSFRKRGAGGELYVRIAEDRYLLVHRWGRRSSRYDALRAWPVRHPLNLIASVLLASIFIALVLPPAWIDARSTVHWMSSARLLVFFWTSMVLAAATGYWFFATGRTFSSDH
jgi:hypothetical protein